MLSRWLFPGVLAAVLLGCAAPHDPDAGDILARRLDQRFDASFHTNYAVWNGDPREIGMQAWDGAADDLALDPRLRSAARAWLDGIDPPAGRLWDLRSDPGSIDPTVRARNQAFAARHAALMVRLHAVIEAEPDHIEARGLRAFTTLIALRRLGDRRAGWSTADLLAAELGVPKLAVPSCAALPLSNPVAMNCRASGTAGAAEIQAAGLARILADLDVVHRQDPDSPWLALISNMFRTDFVGEKYLAPPMLPPLARCEPWPASAAFVSVRPEPPTPAGPVYLDVVTVDGREVGEFSRDDPRMYRRNGADVRAVARDLPTDPYDPRSKVIVSVPEGPEFPTQVYATVWAFEDAGLEVFLHGRPEGWTTEYGWALDLGILSPPDCFSPVVRDVLRIRARTEAAAEAVRRDALAAGLNVGEVNPSRFPRDTWVVDLSTEAGRYVVELHVHEATRATAEGIAAQHGAVVENFFSAPAYKR